MSPAIATVIKMMESLPAAAQERVSEQLRTFIAELEDELKWNELFEHSADTLVEAARKARAEAEAGMANPLQFPES